MMVLCFSGKQTGSACARCVFFQSQTERGSVARSGIPCTSSCSDDVMPRLKAERTKTVSVESNPISMPSTIISALRFNPGIGCGCRSMIRTFPIVLAGDIQLSAASEIAGRWYARIPRHDLGVIFPAAWRAWLNAFVGRRTFLPSVCFFSRNAR